MAKKSSWTGPQIFAPKDTTHNADYFADQATADKAYKNIYDYYHKKTDTLDDTSKMFLQVGKINGQNAADYYNNAYKGSTGVTFNNAWNNIDPNSTTSTSNTSTSVQNNTSTPVQSNPVPKVGTFTPASASGYGIINRTGIRNNPGEYNERTYSIMNDVLSKYNTSLLPESLGAYNGNGNWSGMLSIFNHGRRGGSDRARERALVNGQYNIIQDKDGYTYLRFNDTGLNRNSNNSFGYDISQYLQSSTPSNNSTTTSYTPAATSNSSTSISPVNQDLDKRFNRFPNINTDFTVKNAFPTSTYNIQSLYDSFTPNTSYIKKLGDYNFKNGGTINNNNMNYYQDGGAVTPQQDPQQQIIALVQAAQQGDQQAQQTIQQIQQAAQQGDQQASQIMQIIQQVMQQMSDQAQSARNGAKLQYLAQLRGICPQGQHTEYFKAGGRICKKCVQDTEPSKKCGGKVSKKCGGGVTKGINMIKAELGAELESQKKNNGPVRKHIQLKDNQYIDDNGRVRTVRDRATRDSIVANKGDQGIMDTMPGTVKPNSDGIRVWTPDRTKPPYNITKVSQKKK